MIKIQRMQGKPAWVETNKPLRHVKLEDHFTRSRRGAPGADPTMASSTTTMPPTMARWTAQGAVVASEPPVPVASTL